MDGIWLLVVLLSVVTFAIKGFGPAVVGDRELPARFRGVVALLASALLAALVVTSALADDRGPAGEVVLHVGADTAGVAVAGLLLWLRAPLLVVVLGAALVAGGLRALGYDS